MGASRVRPLTSDQLGFLAGFAERDDPRTLLVARSGTGKTTAAKIVATQLLAEGAIDYALLVASTRSAAQQWQILPIDEDLRDHFAGRVRATTYAELITTPDQIWGETPPETRWLAIFEDVDWIADRIELISADLFARFPKTRALFIAQTVPPIECDALFSFEHEVFDRQALSLPDTQARLTPFAPSIDVLQKVQRRLIQLDDLTWREFEHLIARMLEVDGYDVELMRGTKDGGVDVVAVKDIHGVGLFKSVWQAKKNRINRKVNLSVVRELADTRQEHSASKGIIVTTSFLTRDALARVQRDRYLLSKMDRDDLEAWLSRSLNSR
jgi:hypothetical protein